MGRKRDIMSFIYKIFPNLPEIPKDKILKISKWLMVAVIGLAYVYFLFRKDFHTYQYSDGTEYFAWFKFIFTTGLFAVLEAIAIVPNKLSKKWNRRITIIVLLLAPLGLWYALEYVLFTKLFNLRLYMAILNVIIIVLIMSIGFIISGSYKFGVVLGTIITAVFGLVTHFLYIYRGSPLLFSDFADVRTAGNVAANYSYELDFRTFMFMVGCFAICLVVCKLRSLPPVSWKVRLVALIIFIITSVIVVYLVVFSTKWDDEQIKVSTFRPMKYGYHKNGAYLTLLRSAKITIVQKPDDYSVETAKAITDKYEKQFAAQAEKIKEYKTPNVIAIMCESFSDLQNVGEPFETNKEVLPFYNSLKENTIKGTAYASKIGGGTANSEFEFLTGNSLAFLPLGSSPYQLYIKDSMPSLNSTLKSEGYQGIIGLHPYRKDGYNRIATYEHLGFNKFLGEDDFTDPKLYREYISDEANYDKIIELYEAAKKKSDDPFYLFSVTMQNHSSYDKTYDNLPIDVKVTSEDYTTTELGENQELNQVLTLLHKSDQAIKELVEYFENQEEETIVIFFGDHQPKLPDGFYVKTLGDRDTNLTSEVLMNKYKVPFFIWANYDIEEKTYDKISMNYLQSIALEAAGMEMTDYSKYLLELRKQIPAITIFGHYDNEGNFYNTDDRIVEEKKKEKLNPDSLEAVTTQTPQDEILEEYNKLVYNNLFDVKNRINSFFYLDKK